MSVSATATFELCVILNSLHDDKVEEKQKEFKPLKVSPEDYNARLKTVYARRAQIKSDLKHLQITQEKKKQLLYSAKNGLLMRPYDLFAEYKNTSDYEKLFDLYLLTEQIIRLNKFYKMYDFGKYYEKAYDKK